MTDEQIGKVVVAKLDALRAQPRARWCGQCRGTIVGASTVACITCGKPTEAMYTISDIRAALRPVALAHAVELVLATEAVGK